MAMSSESPIRTRDDVRSLTSRDRSGVVVRSYRFAARPTTAQARYLRMVADGFHAAWNQQVAIERTSVELFGIDRRFTRRDGSVGVDRRAPRKGEVGYRRRLAWIAEAQSLPTWKSTPDHRGIVGFWSQDIPDVPWELMPGQVIQAAQRAVSSANSAFYGLVRHGHTDARPPSYRSHRRCDPTFWHPAQDRVEWFSVHDPNGRATSARAGWVRAQLPRARSERWTPVDPWVRVVAHRSLPSNGTIRQVTWSMRAGRWFASLTVEEPIVTEPAPPGPVQAGVERGVRKRAYVVAVDESTAETVVDEDWGRVPGLSPAETKRLRLLQRSLSRKHHVESPDCFLDGRHRAGSCGWTPSKRAVRVREQIRALRGREVNRRADHLEVATHNLVERSDHVAFAALDVKTMTRSAKGTVDRPGRNVAVKSQLNRSIQDQQWARMLTRVEQKAERARLDGRTVVVEQIDPNDVSRRCGTCGHTDPANRRGDRFRCIRCGHCDDADRNAAINIATIAHEARLGRADRPSPTRRGRLDELRSPDVASGPEGVGTRVSTLEGAGAEGSCEP